MAHSVTPFLMFEGKAEEAMGVYASLFEGAAITAIDRYGPDEAGTEGSVRRATLRLSSQELICIDSPVHHAFTFTPSVSLFVECEDEAELERLYAGLMEDGQALMPLDNYGFSRRFGWLNDRFGVSWQLNLA
ncbi:VOC family protein [Allosphingosinicella sp.]|uniref:VOC family protein n=1 Tax=Allosphingosinicella sp. TaxID=2823234 RepID=UPI002FC24000